MGIKNIMAAKKILLVATGSAKADALYKSLYGPITPNVPASILQLHQDVSVVADEDALSLIKEKGLLLYRLLCDNNSISGKNCLTEIKSGKYLIIHFSEKRGKNQMIIKNGKVFQEDGSYKVTDLYVENGRIVASADEVTDKTQLDASGLKILPGLVDIHSHGAVRHDFSDADVDGLRTILQYEKSQGITSYCPTSMTLPKEELLKIFQTAKDVEQDETCARIVGINMEGPFLDPAKKGAHVEGYIRKPDIEFFRACNEAAGGMIKLVTLAPNMEGSEEFIRELHNEVVISIGHTAADYGCAAEAMKEGALHVTHLYNAMNPR